MSSTDGFRTWLDKATRVEEDVDWTVHTVDYGLFKERLKFFARRRAKLRSLLAANGSEERISEAVLSNVLKQFSGTAPGATAAPYGPSGTDYRPLVDGGPPEPSSTQINASSDSNSAASVSDQSSQNSKSDKGKNKRSVMRRVSNMERQEMMLFLKWEMDKVHMFFISQWQRLSQLLEQQQQTLSEPNVELGDEILELLAFCVVNIVTVHQILVRYDAFARIFDGMPMFHYYLKKVTRHGVSSSYRKILDRAELVAIANTYSQYLEESQQSSLVVHFEAQRVMFREILASTQTAQAQYKPPPDKDDPDYNNNNILTKSILQTARELILMGFFEDRLGLEPAYLIMRGRALTPEMQQLAEWRKKKHEILPQPSKSTVKHLTGMQVFHLTLNLLSAFLYCMNYYIVEPSSTMYVNRLGAHDAMSGTLIGMLPLAAFLSSIPFSYWTNRSFRHPFILSGCLLIVGNFVYSLADQFQRVEIALAGRFLAGLGAPKCIIRRYMADTTPMSLRTSVNALFGMVVAAGSAMGPAMAILLNRFEYTTVFRFVGIVTFNGLTLPGYFMASLWLTFTLVVLATFEEPDRQGLEEQKRLEEETASSHIGSPTVSPSPSRVDMRTAAFATTSSSLSLPQEEPLATPQRESSALSHHHHQELMLIFSGDYGDDLTRHESFESSRSASRIQRWRIQVRQYLELITLPVRLCLGLLFAKVFTIEALVSATSALSKNRYGWAVQQVGTLGLSNGLLVIPFSIAVGRLSMSYQDQLLMRYLVCIGCFGLFLLIDITDLVDTPTGDYNAGHVLAVGPHRYICGYFLAYLSIQSFEGVIGSTLSKVIPTALAAGTLNSGLLATLVDTSGRACGDLFISLCGFIELRQLMNLLFIPGFFIMLTCLVVIERYKDMLAV